MPNRSAGYWVTHSTASKSVSTSDAAYSVRPSPDLANRVHSLVSRLLFGVSSPFLLATRLRAAVLPGFRPSSRHHRRCPLGAGALRLPLRSVHRFSQPLDGLRHLRLCGPIASRSHVQGSSVQGLLPSCSRPGSSPGGAPMPLSPKRSPAETDCHARTTRLRGLAPQLDAFLGVGV
jgi:hypothetical protein